MKQTTVECRYNAVQFVRYIIINYRKLGRISISCWIHKRHTIPRPKLWGVCDRVIKAPHCILIKGSVVVAQPVCFSVVAVRHLKKQVHSEDLSFSTARCRYNVVNFPPNPHNKHLITRPWGRDMGCLLWFYSKIWFTFCHCCRIVECNIVTNWIAI